MLVVLSREGSRGWRVLKCAGEKGADGLRHCQEPDICSTRIADISSKNQEQWDATEAQAKQLESLLRAYKLWDDKILFVNDEYETSGEPVKGWGETVASTLAGGASFLAGKIAGFTDRCVDTPLPLY